MSLRYPKGIININHTKGNCNPKTVTIKGYVLFVLILINKREHVYFFFIKFIPIYKVRIYTCFYPYE